MSGPRVLWRRPTADDLHALCEELAMSPFSYADVGFTRGGWTVKSPLGAIGSVDLGTGEAVVQAAVAALFRRQMFVREGIVVPVNIEVSEEQAFAYGARFGGAWTLQACRVVYVQRSEDSPRTWAFGHGTLQVHGVRGEERFEVRVDPESGQVRFTIVQASWPANLLVRIGTPMVRRAQRQFIEQSLRAFQQAVEV